MDYFLEVRQCMYCKTYFRELTNLGSWECKYHPKLVDYGTGRFRCCNQLEGKELLSSEYCKSIPYASLRHRKSKRSGTCAKRSMKHVEGCTRRDHVFKDMRTFTAEEFADLDKELICAMDECLPLKDRPGFQEFDSNNCIARAAFSVSV